MGLKCSELNGAGVFAVHNGRKCPVASKVGSRLRTSHFWGGETVKLYRRILSFSVTRVHVQPKLKRVDFR